MPSQMNQPTKPLKSLSSDGLKQTDIRNMFTKSSSSTEINLDDKGKYYF